MVKGRLIFDHEDASNLIAILGGLMETLERARPRNKDIDLSQQLKKAEKATATSHDDSKKDTYFSDRI